MKRWRLPAALLGGLIILAAVDPPLGWLNHSGSWLMVAAAVGLVWAIWQRQRS